MYIYFISLRTWTLAPCPMICPIHFSATPIINAMPWEINLEPENHWFVEEANPPMVLFQVPC